MICCSDIMALVADWHGISIESLPDRSRLRKFVYPRQEAMFLCRTMIREGTGRPLSLVTIGRRFGNRDHTTVISAIRAIEKRMADPECRRDVDSLSVSVLLTEGI